MTTTHDDPYCIVAATVDCAKEFPRFEYLGVAVGGEVRKKIVGFTLAGGPGAFHAQDSKGTHFGLLAKADVTFHVGNHFGWVVSGSSRRVPNYRGNSLSVNSLSVGIRVD